MQSAGKHVRVSHDWFWFYFWLDKKLARVFLSRSCGVESSEPITFRHSNENRSIMRMPNGWIGSSFIFPFLAAFLPWEEPFWWVNIHYLVSFPPRPQFLIHFEKQIHIFTTLLSVFNWCVFPLWDWFSFSSTKNKQFKSLEERLKRKLPI